ncbi:hypothetical protein PR048_016503 [Dryococelus australis]|uniref:Glucose-methanol-choline oxidoreductase N-terminal domain-containing protein n=1 Tax=Dryococelus australis TaxID=614101 RepID=A0ABQ9HK35_9NEOP|nr:hypothetical protein PR048_016503 [Dryococelus australis]
MQETLTLLVATLITAANLRSIEQQGHCDTWTCTAADDVYDFVIVGAGSSGSVVSSRLSENPNWKIAVLEAGGEEPYWSDVPALSFLGVGSDADWKYKSQAQRHSCIYGCSLPAGKCLGGTSTMGDMLYSRGSVWDFNYWRYLGNYGWGYSDVCNYFERYVRSFTNVNKIVYESLENFPYVDENIAILFKAFLELGFKNISSIEPKQGVSVAKTIFKNGNRANSYKTFLKPVLQSRQNLKLISYSTVTRVLLDSKRMMVYGVEYGTQTGKIRKLFATKEVILCAGAVGSPKILMLSGIGPRKVLESLNIPVIQELMVGYNLQDHVSFGGFLIFLNGTAQMPSSEEKYLHLIEYLRTRNGPFVGTGPLQLVAYMKSRFVNAHPFMNIPDILFRFVPDTRKEEPCCFYKRIYVRPTVLQPQSRGRIFINSTDPFQPPVIILNYLKHKLDELILLEGVYFVQQHLMKSGILRRAGYTIQWEVIRECQHLKPHTITYWRCMIKATTVSGYNMVGTCSMGPPSNSFSVVDPELQVYGLWNLRVADASVIPHIMTGGTGASCLMIGEKVSDLIKFRWLSNNIYKFFRR